MKSHIANGLTLCNLLCGCLSIWFSFHQQWNVAALLIVLGGLIDFFDGFVARALQSTSEIGKELDSLSDVVSFGVAPGFFLLLVSNAIHVELYDESASWWYGSAAFLIPLGAAYRLATFNILPPNSHHFSGLPSPAAGFWVVSFGMIWIQENWIEESDRFGILYLSLFSFLVALFMNVRIPMFTLKFSDYGWKGNQVKIIFCMITLILLLLFQWKGLFLSISLYILLSIALKIKNP